MGNPRPAGGTRFAIRHATGTGTSVGNTFQEVQIQVPQKGLLRRIRANVTAGTAISQVAIEIRESSGATGNNVVASYPLQAEPLDDDLSVGPLFYSVTASGSEMTGPLGNLFCAVRVDDATADHTIEISFDVEACD
jgi:hypothetical protein